MIRSYKGITPKIGARVYVDESAQVIGDVELGDLSHAGRIRQLRPQELEKLLGRAVVVSSTCIVDMCASGVDPAVSSTISRSAVALGLQLKRPALL